MDDDVLLLHKPSGLLCVPGRGADKQDCLSARAQAQWPGALVVHRLDQATSGLVIMARHVHAQRALSKAFAAQAVDKTYHAIVAGVPQECPDTQGYSRINLPLCADWPQRPRQKVDFLQGKPSQTLWRLLHAPPLAPPWPQIPSSLLELRPLSGRTHQLRVHLAAIGHPILGDALYAPETLAAAVPRLLLHASALALEHPRTGEWMQWDCPPPF